MAVPAGLDAATIGAFQNFLGLPATMQWDASTDAAFTAFQNAKGWGDTYGLTGNQEEWANLVSALQNKDTTYTPMKPIARPPRSDNGGVDPFTKTDAPGTTSGSPGGGGPNIGTVNANSLTGLLSEWGLEGLTDWVWQQLQDGNVDILPTLIRQTDQYKQRFKGLEERRAKGLNVMSEAEYLSLENNYRYIIKQYGVPSGFYDSRDFMAELIAKDVSPNEFNARLKGYADAAFNAPKETRDELRRLYGVTEGELTAFFIDPNTALPLIEQRYKAAGVGGASERGGFGQLSLSTNERLAQLGASGNDVGQFQQLARSGELFGELNSFNERMTNDQAALATFGGDAAGAETLKRRAEGRVAAYAGGGSFAESNKGAFGIGSVSN